MKSWIFSTGWVLVGLLCISALLISAGSQDQQTHPSPVSYSPSGASALVELLRQRGYTVTVDPSMNPKIGQKDVALAFCPTFDSDTGDKDALNSLEATVRHGGTIVKLPFEDAFPSASSAPVAAVTTPDGRSLQINASESSSFSETGASAKTTVLGAGPVAYCTAAKIGSGREIEFRDGLGLTNRFLDKNDNAEALMMVFSGFVPKGSRIVFTTATIGDAQEPGLLETIGKWAQDAWWQALFVLGIVILSLNRRFGYPTPYRQAQRGSRELLDAIADSFSRARSSEIALTAANASIDGTIRRNLRLPRDASDGERDRVLPQPLVKSLADLRAAILLRQVPQTEALRLIRRAEGDLETFLAGRRSKDPRQARSSH